MNADEKATIRNMVESVRRCDSVDHILPSVRENSRLVKASKWKHSINKESEAKETAFEMQADVSTNAVKAAYTN